MSEEGADNWAISLQFNVPIWTGRIEAARREARKDLLRSMHERQAARNRVFFDVADAIARVRTHEFSAALLRSTLIPQARQTYELTLTGYQAGTSDFLDLIESWRRWLDFELMLHRELAELEISFSDLQREIGAEIVFGPGQPADDK
jgi:outer membrane protein TolC